jgi:predicted MFS family arabinose efflux permease
MKHSIPFNGGFVNNDIEPQPMHKVKGRWRSLFTIGFSMTMDSGEGSGFFQNLFPVIRESLNLSLTNLGVIAAIPRIVGLFFGPFWAYMSLRFNRKTILVLVTGFWGLWAIAIGMSQSLWQIYLFITISVIGAAASQPIAQEMMTDLFTDDERGTAMSVLRGGSSILGIGFVPAAAWLATIPDGWRYGFFGVGVISAISGLLMWIFVRDPGRGATEKELQDLDRELREKLNVMKWDEVKQLFKNKTFTLIVVQRLLSGHLLMITFGVVYLVDIFGYDTPQANLIMIPHYIGMLLGFFLGGFTGDRIHRRYPKYGRIGVIQTIQVVYVIAAFFGTQILWKSQTPFLIFFFIMGLMSTSSAGSNRPVIASVVSPEMRGTAFAVFSSVFEGLAHLIYSLLAGKLGETFGLKPVFTAILVVLMVVNVLYCTLMYKPYARDVEAMHQQLQEKRKVLTAPN